mgnify:CR=1 FL=1
MAQDFAPTEPTLMVVPWHDPVVDSVGFDVRSSYVELFWLNVLGPSAMWALRRLVIGLDRYPLGYELDLGETANELGLSYSSATSSTFVKANRIPSPRRISAAAASGRPGRVVRV